MPPVRPSGSPHAGWTLPPHVGRQVHLRYDARSGRGTQGLKNCLRRHTIVHRNSRRVCAGAGSLPPLFLDGPKSTTTTRATFACRNQLRSHFRNGNPLFSGWATLSTPATGASTDAGRHALGPEHTPPRASLALRRCTCMRPWRLFRKRRCRARPYLTPGRVRNGGMQLATRFSEIGFSTRTHVRTPPFSTSEQGGVRKLFVGNRRDTAPRWSAWSLEAQAC